MPHEHFFEISAKDHYQLGAAKGELFGEIARETLDAMKASPCWNRRAVLSGHYLLSSENNFQHYIDEMEGYADASGIPFIDMWTMSLEDDFDYLHPERCTSIVTNDGKLGSYNEDWYHGAKNLICVLKKTIGNLTTLELFYYNTLGGSTVCANSNGYATMVNSLTHTDRSIGVPRNVIARWLSDTANIEEDIEIFQRTPRSLGNNYVIFERQGSIYDIECSAERHEVFRPSSPFVHTNHFLSEELAGLEANNNASGTYQRYASACRLVSPDMTVEQIMQANSNQQEGTIYSIMNERTIGKMIIDMESFIANVWLRRENEAGWIDYDIGFMS